MGHRREPGSQGAVVGAPNGPVPVPSPSSAVLGRTAAGSLRLGPPARSERVLRLYRRFQSDKVRDPGIVRQEARVFPGVEVNGAVRERHAEHRPTELHLQAPSEGRARSPSVNGKPLVSVGADSAAEQDEGGNLPAGWEVAAQLGAQLLKQGQAIEL